MGLFGPGTGLAIKGVDQSVKGNRRFDFAGGTVFAKNKTEAQKKLAKMLKQRR